eukprot:tig00020560_g11086.t1
MEAILRDVASAMPYASRQPPPAEPLASPSRVYIVGVSTGQTPIACRPVERGTPQKRQEQACEPAELPEGLRASGKEELLVSISGQLWELIGREGALLDAFCDLARERTELRAAIARLQAEHGTIMALVETLRRDCEGLASQARRMREERDAAQDERALLRRPSSAPAAARRRSALRPCRGAPPAPPRPARRRRPDAGARRGRLERARRESEERSLEIRRLREERETAGRRAQAAELEARLRRAEEDRRALEAALEEQAGERERALREKERAEAALRHLRGIATSAYNASPDVSPPRSVSPRKPTHRERERELPPAWGPSLPLDWSERIANTSPSRVRFASSLAAPPQAPAPPPPPPPPAPAPARSPQAARRRRLLPATPCSPCAAEAARAAETARALEAARAEAARAAQAPLPVPAIASKSRGVAGFVPAPSAAAATLRGSGSYVSTRISAPTAAAEEAKAFVPSPTATAPAASRRAEGGGGAGAASDDEAFASTRREERTRRKVSNEIVAGADGRARGGLGAARGVEGAMLVEVTGASLKPTSTIVSRTASSPTVRPGEAARQRRALAEPRGGGRDRGGELGAGEAGGEPHAGARRGARLGLLHLHHPDEIWGIPRYPGL